MNNLTSADSISAVFMESEEFRDSPLCPLFTLCSIYAGDAISSDDLSGEKAIPVYGSNGIRSYADKANHLEDQVLVGRQGSVGTVHFAEAPFWAAEHALIVEPRTPRVSKSWLKYVLEAIDLSRLSRAVAQPGINATSVSFQRVPHIPFEQQKVIGDYLDRETAEIDAAVADLDRYVELLEKRKRATGLAILEQARHEPTTLMVHLGSLGLFVSGSGFPHRYQGVEGEEFPFYKVGSLSTADEDGIIQDSRHSVSREVAEELGAKIIPTGSVLMAKIGEAMRLCRFVVTATDCCIDNNMMAIIPRQDNITSDYLRLALELVTVDVLVNPGPVPSLNVQGLRMFSIPLPSVGVQKRMTTEWNKETNRLDSLIAESTRLRDLLIKRRSVLITEVVTGRKQV